MIKIAPSILAADFSKLGDAIKQVEEAEADMLHIDVMDGRFVPNISIGPPVVKSIRKVSRLVFDVHLMIENPENYLDDFAEAGADIITVHAETCPHLDRTLQYIKQLGKNAGVALNPSTPLSAIDWVIHKVDMVLLMTVNPGFGGQSYIEGMTGKIACLKNKCEKEGARPDIQVDGGMDLENIGVVTEAGANVIVAGTTIFGARDIKGMIRQLREKAIDNGGKAE